VSVTRVRAGLKHGRPPLFPLGRWRHSRSKSGLATVVTFVVLVAFVFFFFGKSFRLERLNISIGCVDARIVCVVAPHARALGSSGGVRSLNRAAPHLPLLVKSASVVYKSIECIGCGGNSNKFVV
jgi:hypothetical protein